MIGPVLAVLLLVAPSSEPEGGSVSLTRKADASTCLERMAAHPSGDGAATFGTELECEEWEAIVLLEGDVRTATLALALCERTGRELAALRDPRASDAEPATAPAGPVADLWHVLRSAGGAALGGAAGAGLGFATDHERPGPVIVGGLAGALLGALISEVL